MIDIEVNTTRVLIMCLIQMIMAAITYFWARKEGSFFWSAIGLLQMLLCTNIIIFIIYFQNYGHERMWIYLP